jgi:hypothetical protein
MSAILKEGGCILKKGGGGKGLAAAHAARRANAQANNKESLLTPELLDELVKEFDKNPNISALIAEYGIPRPILTAALKARGCKPQKGRKKKAA